MGKKTLWLSFISLVSMMVFFELTNTDLALQEFFFDFKTRSWYFKDPTNLYRAIFYTGTKVFVATIGLGVLIASIISWKKNKWKEYRKGFVIVITTLIVLPLSIALVGKKVTDVQCPDDVKHFRGIIPYVKLFEKYPPNPDAKDGRWYHGNCFPAGHASGGFALLSLFCLFKSRRNKILALIFAMSMGWIMGGYQMIRGMHFLSHHLTTMFLALIFISTLNLLIKEPVYESIESQN